MLGEFCNRRPAIYLRGEQTRHPSRITDRQESLLSFPTTKLSRVTFEFLSISSEGMIVLHRRVLVYVYFKLNEEEAGTGCFLLNSCS